MITLQGFFQIHAEQQWLNWNDYFARLFSDTSRAAMVELEWLLCKAFFRYMIALFCTGSRVIPCEKTTPLYLDEPEIRFSVERFNITR